VAWLTRDAEVLASVMRWAEAPWPSLEGALVLDGPALVHTWRSPVSLDVAWCQRRDAQLEVRRVARVPPRRVARPCFGVAVVAPVGAFERWCLQVGDLLELHGF
jgi:hypothetical protein